jgi:murein L,D-transpeptidase YafK
MRFVCFIPLLISLIVAQAIADEKVPAYVLRLPDSVSSVFIAETSKARFHRFENGATNALDYRGSSYMSIGDDGDHKQVDGDRKTPLGIYFVTEQLDTERMHEKYGYTAFTLDYPNALDRRMQRSGAGIWVHGVDRRGGKRPPFDTDGCIALPNDTLAELEEYFQPNVTPVIIARTVEWVAPGRVEELRRELEAVVSRWIESRQQGDLYAFLSLYDEDFRHWGMNRSEWIAFQAETLQSRAIQSIVVDDLMLLADTIEVETYLSRFRMSTNESGNTVVVTKRLYWRRGSHGLLKLIAEDSG